MIKKSGLFLISIIAVLLANIVMFMSVDAYNDQSNTTEIVADALTVIGSASVELKHPIEGMVVIVFPIDNVSGKAVTRQSSSHATLAIDEVKDSATNEWMRLYRTVGGWPILNPTTTTDSKGNFSVSVSKSFFDGYKPGEFSIGIFVKQSDLKFFFSRYELETFKYNAGVSRVDVGKVQFKTIKQ